MGKVVGFTRPRRRRGSRRASWWRTPWLPLAAALGAAIVLYLEGGGVEATVADEQFAWCGSQRQRTCVVDGDTIRYRGVRIRLADIDAPELYSPRCASEKDLARRATVRLTAWMNEGPFDIVLAGDRDEDRYGRKLRTLVRGGRSAGSVLVSEGLARRWDGRRRSWCGMASG